MKKGKQLTDWAARNECMGLTQFGDCTFEFWLDQLGKQINSKPGRNTGIRTHLNGTIALFEC